MGSSWYGQGDVTVLARKLTEALLGESISRKWIASNNMMLYLTLSGFWKGADVGGFLSISIGSPEENRRWMAGVFAASCGGCVIGALRTIHRKRETFRRNLWAPGSIVGFKCLRNGCFTRYKIRERWRAKNNGRGFEVQNSRRNIRLGCSWCCCVCGLVQWVERIIGEFLCRNSPLQWTGGRWSSTGESSWWSSPSVLKEEEG